MRQVALLRGINLLRSNRLPMKELAAIFSACGARNVQTLLASGNVVFDGPTKGLCAKVEAAIEEQFGFRPPLQLRSAEQMEAIVRDNPFPGEEAFLHVMFLASAPSEEAVAGLDPNRSPGDRFLVSGREIYQYLPRGVAETRLTNAWFDSRLKTVSTLRNWRTTLKLLELVR